MTTSGGGPIADTALTLALLAAAAMVGRTATAEPPPHGGPEPVAATNETAAAAAEEATVQLSFRKAPLATVLDLYGELTEKTILLDPDVPEAEFTLKTRRITETEAVLAIETLLHMHGIATLPYQDEFVRVVPLADLPADGGLPVDNLQIEFPAPPPAKP